MFVLQISQKLHESWILAPRLLSFAILDLAFCKCFGLHLQIDFGIHVGRAETHMTQPGSNSVDIHTRSKQVGGGRVANRVRTYAFLRQGRQYRRHMCDVAFDQRMNSEARKRLPSTVEEDMLGCRDGQ